MKVLLVIDSFTSAGAQRQFVQLAKALSDGGYEVTALNYHPELSHFREEMERHTELIVDVEKNSKVSLRPIIEIYRTLRNCKIDRVVSFLSVPNFYSILACIIAPRIRLVVCERSAFPTQKISIVGRLLYWMYHFADVLCVNSFYQLGNVQRYFPRLSRNAVVIYNAIDLDRFDPGQPHVRDSTDGYINAIAIGSLRKLKNPLTLIRAMRICMERGLDVRVSWVGRKGGTEELDRLFADCTAELSRLGISDNWRWLGVQGDIASHIRRSDVTVHPSFYEGLSNAVCESLACGNIVLAGDICEHPRLVGSERGFLFDPNSAESIACAFERFASLTEQKKREMRNNCRRFAEHNLSPQKFSESFLRIVQ